MKECNKFLVFCLCPRFFTVMFVSTTLNRGEVNGFYRQFILQTLLHCYYNKLLGIYYLHKLVCVSQVQIKYKMAQPFPSPIHSMSAIHGCLLCSVAYLLALVAISLVKCFYFTSSSYILTYYSDSRQ